MQLVPLQPDDRAVPSLATMRRDYRDLGEEIAAERAGSVVDFVFLRAMEDRRQKLLGDMARLYAATDGAIF